MQDDDLDTEGLSPLQAYDAVRRFAQRAGTLPLRLALHAALPQVLHADLLHLLRLNFVDDGRANPVTEADVLFAAFCNDLGQAYFRFDPHARAQLLAELDASYPDERRHRSLQVAEFLLQYFERERVGERAGTDAMYRSWIEVERWNALAFADPEAAAEQLAEVLQSAAEPAQAAARLRVGTLARTLAQPLVRHQKLLAYAAGIQALQARADDEAKAFLRRLGDGPVEVGAVRLPGAADMLRRLVRSTAGSATATDAPEGAAAAGAETEAAAPDAAPSADLQESIAHTAPPGGYDVFLSCAAADGAWGDRLKADLGARGLTVFWGRQLSSGTDWESGLDRALGSSRNLVCLWSAKAAASDGVQRELARFRLMIESAEPADRKILLVPLDDTRSPWVSFAQIDEKSLGRAYAAGPTGVDEATWGRVVERVDAMLRGQASTPVTVTSVPAVPALADCDFTAFISYAHADDAAWFGWVGDFRIELERGLAAMLRGVRLPPMHLSSDNGPVAGVLSDQLRSRIDASFVLIVVVHDNYVQSEWALRELELFKERFGEQALRDRLYVIAMSESAIKALEARPEWQRLLGDSASWMPFFDRDHRERPLEIYLSAGIVSPSFRQPFERLRADLAAKIRQARSAGAGTGVSMRAPSEPEPPAPRPAPIEPPPGVLSTEMAVGYLAGGASARLDANAIARLEAMGLRPLLVSQIDVAVKDRPALARAKHLVLPFDNQTLQDGGGHLETIRRAWIEIGRDGSSITWLDLRTPEMRLHSTGAARWVESLGVHTFTLESWLQTMEQAMRTAASPRQAQPPARLYIESNRYERTHWEAFGRVLRERWLQVVREAAPRGELPELRSRGLPIDQLDAFPDLDDADGVILLWGRKTSDALVAQINRVERKIPAGRDAPPGLVAYLMPPQPHADEPVPAWGWEVLRFHAADEGGAIELTSLDDERAELDRFLLRVHARWLRRQVTAGAGPSAA